MLKPRGLGRRVAQGPHSFPAFSDNSRQKTHQTKSVTFRFRCHCDLFSPVETDSGALSDNSRQNQAESGNFRQNQAISGEIRPFSGIFRQNQAESGKIRQNRATQWIWKIIGQGPMLLLQSNCNQWHHSSQDMATVLTNPRHCHSLLNPIKMSACARKHCGRNVFLPAVSSHGHPVVAENKV